MVDYMKLWELWDVIGKRDTVEIWLYSVDGNTNYSCAYYYPATDKWLYHGEDFHNFMEWNVISVTAVYHDSYSVRIEK